MPADCIFCQILAGSAPSWRVHETEHAVAFLDQSPATRGHTLVVPRRHAADIWDISRADAGHLMEAVHDVAALLDERLSPDGMTLFQANRSAGWQEVFHLHVHLVPRYNHDQLRPSWKPQSVTDRDLDEVREQLHLSRTEGSRLSQVPTVLGPVDAGGLGRVLMHEHVFVLTEEVRQNYPAEWGDEDARVAEAVARLRELPAHGIGTIVDVTVIGQGRNIQRLKRIAEQVPGLNIIVAAGIYTFDEVPLFFSRRPSRTMTEFFISDITEGIAGTGVKAGMLKCAVDEKGLTRGTERVLRAVAGAHRETGAPVTIHTHAAGQHGQAILDVLLAEGADLSRVVLGHSGDSKDPDYLTRMAESGIILGMDRFGIDHFATFTERADLVVELCRRGLAEAMVLSHDCSVYLDWFAPGTLDDLKDWHYLHVSQDVLPYLREHGVSDDQIDAMLVRTPARILAGALPRYHGYADTSTWPVPGLK